MIAELKKGRTPREVIAQILEYAAWGSLLTYDDLNRIASEYYKKHDCDFDKNLLEPHQEAFNPDAEEEQDVEFNRNLNCSSLLRIYLWLSVNVKPALMGND